MPTFGDYETTGEPLATTDGTGHYSQIWLARKVNAAEDRAYALKIYAPRPGRRAAESSEDSLEEDRALEYLEGVKQIKKAQTEGGAAGRSIIPIHQFGKTPEGDAAWYVTDFYGETEPFLPRSLQSYIMRGGRLDGPALRNIVHSVVTGCLALQRSRGYSHGNLKSSNVFRVGKSLPLRKTPIELADAFPAAPVQFTSVDLQDLQGVGELLQQTMEVQDLRSIGMLILQLVEGRLIATEREYDYPVQSSPAWERLGKDAERWREVCNRLLDPSLALEQVNLAALEMEFRPTPVNMPMVLASLALALVCLIAAGGYFYLHGRKKQTNPTLNMAAPQIAGQPASQTKAIGGSASFKVTASSASPLSYQWRKDGAALAGETNPVLVLNNLAQKHAGNYDVAVRNPYTSVTSAMAILKVTVPASQAAQPPREQITQPPREQTVAQPELQAARQAFASATNDYVTNLIGALRHVTSALALAPSDAGALQLRSKIVDAIGNALEDALQKGTQALGQTNLEAAMKQRNAALQLKPDDARAARLSSDVYNAALFGATNAVEGQTVNLDEAERQLKYLREINPAAKETSHVNSLIQEFDKLIAQAFNQAQAAADADVKTITQATNLINALDGTGVFDWRPSRTNVTAKLIEQLERKRIAGLEMTFTRATNAVAANNIAAARDGLEIMKTLNPSDPRLATLDRLIAAAARPAPSPPASIEIPSKPERNVVQAPVQEIRYPTNYFGIDFVWVKGVGAGGAYVGVNELSWAGYHALGGRQLTKGQRDVDATPANFPSAAAAREFAATVSGNFASKGFSVRLPTLQEYLTMTGVLTKSEINTGDMASLVAAGEHIEEFERSFPDEITMGTKNQNGLRDVVGNLREWTSDKPNPFGLPYFVPRARGSRPPYNDLNRKSNADEPFGLRLVLIPANGSAPSPQNGAPSSK
jgi:hypothetical protein